MVNASHPPSGVASIDFAASIAKNKNTSTAAALSNQIHDDFAAGSGSDLTTGRRTTSQMPPAIRTASIDSTTARPVTPAHNSAKNSIETTPMPRPAPSEISKQRAHPGDQQPNQ
jgi:hypothetical protein